jgi:hypothetical protein
MLRLGNSTAEQSTTKPAKEQLKVRNKENCKNHLPDSTLVEIKAQTSLNEHPLAG